MAAKKTTTTKKVMFKWEEAYTDLPENIAEILREKRIKPDQLAKMADGELLAVEGINDVAIAQIRDKYAAELTEIAPKAVVKEEEVELAKPKSTSPRLKYPTHVYGRSARYKAKKTKVEDKSYSLNDAVTLLRKVSYSKLKTIELHINTKDATVRGEVSLPHSTGKDIKVAIFNDAIANEIKAGKINFDILLARPADMAKIAPLARVLGPRGVMPSPKNGTITETPEERAKQLTAGATLSYKTEAKAPIIHLSIGNLKQKDNEIIDNVKALINGIGAQKMTSVFLKSTMSPSIRLDLNSL